MNVKMNGYEPAYVSFMPKGNKTEVFYSFTTFQKPEANKISCFIPSFNIYFSATDKEMVHKKSVALTKIYLRHFGRHSKGGVKDLVLQLHKLGFKAPNDALTLKRILKDHQAVNAKFKSSNETLPDGFYGAERIEHQEELEVAI